MPIGFPSPLLEAYCAIAEQRILQELHSPWLIRFEKGRLPLLVPTNSNGRSW